MTFKKHLLILAVYAAILLASETAYRAVFGIAPLPSGKIAESFALIFVFCALFSFAKYRPTRVLIFLFFLLSVVANNIHYAVYQSWITGINYWLMFREATEAAAAGSEMIGKLWPHVVWGLAESALFLSLSKWRTHRHAIADCLFAAAMLFISVRSFSTTQELGISPKSTYSRLKANYFSLGYFAGRILPYQLFDLSSLPEYHHDAPPRVSNSKVRNIVLIMGESESAAHIGVFGYHRDTSPFMRHLSADTQAVVQPAYSAALMTAVSLPYFFNAIPHPNGYTQINSGRTNLFRLAQEQGYRTHFYSAQAANEMSILNLIGQKWFDRLTQPTDLGYNGHENMPDSKLLPLLQQTNLTQGNNLVVLHQRGSHVPYGAQLQANEKPFGEATITDRYDNTVLHTDRLIEAVFNHLQQQGGNDWLLVYTSDHGQYLNGEIYNQGTVEAASYTVPLLVYSPNPEVQAAALPFNSNSWHG